MLESLEPFSISIDIIYIYNDVIREFTGFPTSMTPSGYD